MTFDALGVTGAHTVTDVYGGASARHAAGWDVTVAAQGAEMFVDSYVRLPARNALRWFFRD